MDTMSIHRGLAELKLIDSKISTRIESLEPNGVMQSGKLVNGYITKDDFGTNAKAKLDSICDLIERKQRIKTAIVNANSITKVTVAKDEMTIADAITMKSSMVLRKQLVDRLKTQHSHNVGVLNKNNELVEENIQRILEATFSKENVKAGEKDVEAVRKPYLEANEWELVDTLKVEKLIEEMETEIGDFETEVDAVLSEINAVTKITIE